MARENYISEKMRIAAETLAASGTVKDHLFSVAETMSRLQRDDFSGYDPRLADEYTSIMDALCAAGTWEDSIKQLSDEEAEEIGQQITDLALSAEREYGAFLAKNGKAL